VATRASAGFSAERLGRLAQLERWHFWFIGRRALVEDLLARHGLHDRPRRLLDVGCGTGLMIERLGARGHRVLGLEARPEGVLAAA